MNVESNANFNPYLKWLGIRSHAPNYYQLLGIEPFEPDLDVIAAAADRQMAHVRKYQNGPNSAQSQLLLNELAAAKVCLLQSENKLAYDIALSTRTTMGPLSDDARRGRRLGRLLSVISSILAIVAISMAFWMIRRNVDVRPDMVERVRAVDASPGTEPRYPTEEIFASPDEPHHDDQVELAAAVAEPDEQSPGDGQGKVVGNRQITEDQPPQPASTPSTDAPSEHLPDRRLAESPQESLVTIVDAVSSPGEEHRDDAQVAPNLPAPWADGKSGRRRPRTPFPEDDSPIARLLRSLHQRNLEAADKLIIQVVKAADDHNQRAVMNRVETQYHKIKEFWQKVDQGLARVDAGSTLEYMGQNVRVAARSESSVTLLAADGEQKVFDTTRAKMDPELAIGLARANGRVSGGALELTIGVFLAMDRQGDLDEAAKRLQLARDHGFPVDVLVARTTAPPVAATGPDDVNRSTGDHDTTVSMLVEDDSDASRAGARDDETASPDAESIEPRSRIVVPSAGVRQQKLDEIQDVYRKEFAARGIEARQQLARTLLKDANRTTDAWETRYVMYDEAIGLAFGTGDVQTADTAIRAIAYNFQCDEDELRLEKLATLRISRLNATQARFLVDMLVQRIKWLVRSDRFDDVHQYLRLAEQAQRRGVGDELGAELKQWKAYVDELHAHFLEVRGKLEQLEAGQTLSADEHLVVAAYLLQRGDTAQALQHVVKTGDEKLAEAVEVELDPPDAVDSWLQLADTWWELADTRSPDTRWSVLARQRAAYWYRRAEPSLTGFSKQKAGQRANGPVRSSPLQSVPIAAGP